MQSHYQAKVSTIPWYGFGYPYGLRLSPELLCPAAAERAINLH
jgi:hypothetical protein